MLVSGSSRSAAVSCPVIGIALVLLVGCSESGSGWSPGREIDTTPGAIFPLLATNATGSQTLALWRQRELEGSSSGLAISWYRGGGRWSAAEIINDWFVPLPAQVAVDDAGNAIVVWIQGNPETRLYEAWGRWYDPKDGWAEPAPLIQPAGFGLNATPLVAFDADGSVLSTWVLERPAEDSPVTLSRCRKGQGCEDLDSFDVASSVSTLRAMKVDTSGRVIVVLSRALTVGNRYDPATGWATPEPFDHPSFRGAPMVQFDGDVAWAFWPGSEANSSATGVVRYVGGSWEKPMFLDTPCPSAGVCFPPGVGAMALDGQGGAVVVWGIVVRADDPANSTAGALWSRYTADDGWAPAQPFPVGGDGGLPVPSLASLDDGTVAALWYQFGAIGLTTGRLSVWANELDPETGWGESTRFTDAGKFSTPSQQLDAPSLVSHGDRAIGLWLQQSSVSSPADDVWSTPWASEFR